MADAWRLEKAKCRLMDFSELGTSKCRRKANCEKDLWSNWGNLCWQLKTTLIDWF